jgi:hypothetical protein
MADGYAVDRAALAETAQGLNGVIRQLKGLGLSETGDVGRGFSGLALSGLQAGHGDVASAFGNFCDRWSWGVRTLVQDGNEFARRLGLAAGLYNDVENQLTGAIKDLVVASVGDPYMTDDQAASASWSQDAALLTGEQTPGGSMTPQQGLQAMRQQWEGVGQTAMSTPDVKAVKAVKDLLGG